MTTRIFSANLSALVRVVDTNLVVPTDYATNLIPLYPANWETGPNVTTSWITDVARSQVEGSEDRRGRRSRPRRTLRMQATSLTPEMTGRLLSAMMSYGLGSMPIPLVSDRTTLTDDTLAGGNTLQCDTTYRRFFRGQQVFLTPPIWKRTEAFGIAVDGILSQISSLTSGSITLTSGVPIDILEGWKVYPLLSCHYQDRSSMQRIERDVLDGDLSFVEMASAATLPPTTSKSLVSVPDSYEERYILNVPFVGDITVGTERMGQRSNIGNGFIDLLTGPRSRITIAGQAGWLNRADFFRTIQFFDLHRGREKSFWMRNPARMYRVVSYPSPTKVRVKGFDFSANVLSYFSHLGIVGFSGTQQIRRVTSVVLETNGDLTLTADSAFDQSEVKAVSSAHLVRFSTDEMTESWTTDEVGFTTLSFTEVLDDSEVSFSIL